MRMRRKTAEGLRGWSAKDAARWPAFQATLQRLGALIGSLFINTPPSVDAPTARDVFALMHTLGDFRSLPKDDQWRLLRWGPMAVADLVSESIDTELLRATVAADGIFGAMLGPWSAGSGLQLLLSSANRALEWPAGRLIAGGPIALARSLEAAATRFGVEIRTGCQVARIDAKDDRAVGVTLDGGEHIEARAVVSGVDPKRTFLTLCDAESPAAGVPLAHEALPIAGHARQGQPRAVGAAVVRRRDARDAGAAACGSRRISITSSARSITRNTGASRRSRGSSSRFRRSAIRRSRRRARTCCPPTCSSRRTNSGIRDGDQGSGVVGRPARRAGRQRGQDADAVRAGSRLADRRAADADAARPRARLGTDRRPDLPRRAVARSVLHDAARCSDSGSTARRSRGCFSAAQAHIRAPDSREARG